VNNKNTKRALCAALLVAVSSAHAGDLSLIINGRSHHSERGKFNENNAGLGLQYDFETSQSFRPFLTASTFRDSANGNAWMLGGGLMREWSIGGDWYVGAGAVAFAMKHSLMNEGTPFLGALPAFSLGTRSVALNLSYIPRTHEKEVSVWAAQLRIALPTN
jgi:hypothetical protein